MADDTEFSEEYIAELLKKDAQKVSASYARSGIYDVLPKRPVGTAPKPNTRFLKNIIRSTDSHNAALKQKELGDAAHRLRALTGKKDGDSRVRSRKENATDRDRDQEKGHRKRKRDYERYGSEGEGDYVRKRSRGERYSPDRDVRYSSRHEAKVDGHTSHRKDRHSRRSYRHSHHKRANSTRSEESDRYTDDSSLRRSSNRSTRKYKETEPISKDQDSDEDDRHDRRYKRRRSNHDRDEDRRAYRSRFESKPHKEHRNRSRSRTEHSRLSKHSSSQSEFSDSASDSRSRRKKSTKTSKPDRYKRSAREDSPSTQHQTKSKPSPSPNKDFSDDDPLASFLGPTLPSKTESAPKIRGRGATNFTSGTETRFSKSYDPHDDITPDIASENEDWEQALEALRDRQKFRQAGAERLLAAGFTQEEVARMERGGEKDESDVKWTKKGQAREWDRGKTIDENGDVALAAEGFGRLV